jgi:hypothetical protein
VSEDGSYSQTADEQLDELEAGDDPELYNAALDACDLVFRSPGLAQSLSTAVQTEEGIRFRLAVAGHAPYKLFWSSTPDGPRIEALFPHP